jgi:acyl-coenzyme A thioesterase PaaI-like protein
VTGTALSEPADAGAHETAEAGRTLWDDFGYHLGELSDGQVQLCAACRRLGHCRLGLTREWLDDEGTYHAELTCPEDHEAGPGHSAHGGWVASALDEVLGHSAILHGALAVTKSLTVHFLRPAPVGRAMLGSSRVASRDGGRWHLEGELRLASSGAVIARAEGVWSQRDGMHYDRFREWLATQDEPGATPATGTGQPGAQPTGTGRPAAAT